MPADNDRGVSFGSRVHAYQRGRRSVPPETCALFHSLLPTRALLLDIGCGTGISTELVARSESIVVGCDVDERMIAEARGARVLNTAFVRAAAESLPFTDALFDGLTAFSAFHWFANDRAVSEMRRVLRPGAPALIVNKYDEDDAKERFRALIEKLTGTSIPDPKKRYVPYDVLNRGGFTVKTAYSLQYVENLDFQDTRSFFISTSIAGQLISSFALSKRAMTLIDAFCESLVNNNGFYVRPVRATAVVAVN